MHDVHSDAEAAWGAASIARAGARESRCLPVHQTEPRALSQGARTAGSSLLRGRWLRRPLATVLSQHRPPTSPRSITLRADLRSSAGNGYVRSLRHPILTREEELEYARRIVDGERALLEALLTTHGAASAFGQLADELQAGSLSVSELLRNVERNRESALTQRRRLARLLGVARRLGSGTRRAKTRERLAARLVDVRLHPRVFDRIAAVSQSARSPRDDAALEVARGARERIAAAKKALVEHNLRLVAMIANRYRNRGLAFLDLVQEGNIGLMHAVDKFDHRKGHRLNTYATWWIKQNIERALADHAPTIRIPVHLLESRAKVLRAGRQLQAHDGASPLPSALAERAGLPLAKVEAVAALPREPLSLDAPLGADTDLRAFDLVANERSSSPYDEATTSCLREQVRALMATLDDRERRILGFRFGLDGCDEKTLAEVGRSLSLTRERIRQIEANALRKLRARCEVRGYRPELEA